MASYSSGPGSNKETVYGGPTLKTQEGTMYNGPTPGGTVHGGPSAGTVYDPARQRVASKARLVPEADPQSFHRAGNTFFLIAGLTLVNTVLAISASNTVNAVGLGITRVFDVAIRQGGSAAPVVFMDALVAAVFMLIGIFTRKGNRTIFVIGAMLYAGDTALLWLDGIARHVPSVGVHCIFLLNFVVAYFKMSRDRS